MRDFEASILGWYTGLTGSTVSAGVCRRNGRAVTRYYPFSTEPEISPPSDEEHLNRLIATFSDGLNAVEQRTWLELLRGRSVAEIAADEGVTRVAVYERIRGNSKGHRGMIAKNTYVALWWGRRARGQL